MTHYTNTPDQEPDIFDADEQKVITICKKLRKQQIERIEKQRNERHKK